MSKYEELTKLACKQTNETFAIKEECESFAHHLANGYKAFLSVPDDKFSIVTLTSDLDVDEVLKGFHRPKLTKANDGFYYFAFAISYSQEGDNAYVNQVIKIGISREESGFCIRMDDDFQISEDYRYELDSICQKIYESDLEYFSALTTKPRRSIGFL